MIESLSFQDKTWCEIEAAVKNKTVVILPVGSTEAHGPHLPLSTDVIISVEMSRRAAQKLTEQGIPTLVLPPMAYSVTDFSRDFPGTISISKATAVALVCDICLSLVNQGFRTICLANSHLEPEHIAALNEAAEEVERQTGIRPLVPDKRRGRWAYTLTEEFRRGACHAGCYETSLVMAAQPELTRDELRQQLEPLEIDLAQKIKAGVTTFKDAGSEQAYFGNPAAATPEEGHSTYEALTTMLVTTILEAMENNDH
jgi:creatinine amidohydrolase